MTDAVQQNPAANSGFSLLARAPLNALHKRQLVTYCRPIIRSEPPKKWNELYS